MDERIIPNIQSRTLHCSFTSVKSFPRLNLNASAKPPRRTNVDPIDNRYAAPIISRGRSSKILAAKKSTSTTKGTTENRQVGLFVTRLATKTRAAGVIFFSMLVPGSGNFQLSRLAGLGYGLGFWVVITIIVSLTITLTLITTLTVILP